MKNEFVNAQEMQNRYPGMFKAPSAAELAAIKQGDFIKVCRNDERFWIRVIGADRKTVTGTIDNHLDRNPDLLLGLIVTVDKDRVYTILK